MQPVGYGILGARSAIAQARVIPAIEAADDSFVAATASLSAGTGSYESVIADPAVEVVYIPLRNGDHRKWTEAAAAAGKHVLCEKPLAPTAADALAMANACERAGVLLAEAWMTPFSTRWSTAIQGALAGEIGEVREVRTRFTFTLGPDRAADYRLDPTQGGGALLDLGIYALGPAVALWSVDPEVIAAQCELSDRGVDLETSFVIAWSGGRRAVGRVSFTDEHAQELEIVGADGVIELLDHAHTGRPDDDPYRPMIEAMTRDVRGTAPWPRPAAEAVAMIDLIDRVAAAARGGR